MQQKFMKGGRIAAIAIAICGMGSAIASDTVIPKNNLKQPNYVMLTTTNYLWPESIIRWHYSTTRHPSHITVERAVALVQQQMAKWSAVCGIRFEYLGTTTTTTGDWNADKTLPVKSAGPLNVVGFAPDPQNPAHPRNSVGGFPVFDTVQYLTPGATRTGGLFLYSTGNFPEVHFQSIVNHELGHLIGIDHSNVQESIMYATPYNSPEFQLTLRQDDISACKSLYGEPKSAGTPMDYRNDAIKAVGGLTVVSNSQEGAVNFLDSVKSTISSISQAATPTNIPAGMKFPAGAVAMSVAVPQQGAMETFSVLMDSSLGVNGYWKRNRQGNWINLASAAQGGKMATSGGRTRLDFQIQDGGEFDDDGAVNGSITETGTGGAARMAQSVSDYKPRPAAGRFWF
jgi:hypothetical protein